ncbi:molybdenum cofactor biosynthesis protein MoaE [Anaerolineales bacterium]
MNNENYITQQPLDPNRLIDETQDDGSGALIIFVGTVRNTNQGKPVDGMTYEAHIPLAVQALLDLETETKQTFAISQCRVQHRIGSLKLGEASVVIVVRAPHRDDAYQASRYMIDELKKRVPIWKEEHYLDGDSRYLDGLPLQGTDL